MWINIYIRNHKPNKVDCISFYFSCIEKLFKDFLKWAEAILKILLENGRNWTVAVLR